MTHQNPKNALQEMHQRLHLDLPRYETSRVGGEAHQPTFRSIVSLPFGFSVMGSICPTKRQAEMSAAQLALEQSAIFDQEPERERLITSQSDRYYFLIDLENQPQAWDELHQKLELDSEMTVYVYATAGHPATLKSYPPLNLRVINSTRRDAADVALTMHLTQLLSSSPTGHFVIITRDHFAAAAVDVAASLYPEAKVIHAVNVTAALHLLTGK